MVLQKSAQVKAMLVQPGKELQSYQDPGSEEGARLRRAAALGGASSGSSQQVPVRIGADQLDVAGGAVGQDRVQPSRDAVEFLISRREGAEVHEGVADVVQVSAGWELIEPLVGDRFAGSGQAGEEGRVRAVLEPVQDPAGTLGQGKRVPQRL
ncbi:hypothetical protein C0R01_06250 [Streptomyces albidoflavus]|nr:hypothetical protein SF12_00510 [Streptomyces sp. MBRL 601]RZE67806.1 hypothetical protein C0R00_06440 [Streptomyces albidoflavus]RZE83513.1 hypothetical protein C0R01_06250 [Streptomyces albidoflavus]